MAGADEREKQAIMAMHPTRVRILATMKDREMSPKEVAVEMGFNNNEMGSVAYHFRPMLEQNVVRVTKTEQVRGAIKTYYQVQPNVLKRARAELLALLDGIDDALQARLVTRALEDLDTVLADDERATAAELTEIRDQLTEARRQVDVALKEARAREKPKKPAKKAKAVRVPDEAVAL